MIVVKNTRKSSLFDKSLLSASCRVERLVALMPQAL